VCSSDLSKLNASCIIAIKYNCGTVFIMYCTNDHKPKKFILMKTKIKILLTIGMFFMVSSCALASKPGKSPDLKEKIRAEVTYPKTALDRNIEGIVLIGFSVNERGNIQIEGVNASNIELQDYVVKTIKNMVVSPTDNAYSKMYNMKFVFKIL
jgi:hypothetical protein